MSRVRNVCFTLNNPTASPDEFKAQCDTLRCTYCVFGRETGASGTPHYQGYIEFPRAIGFPTIKRAIGNAHLEKRRGTAQEAADYCKKDGDFTEWGEISQQGARNDLNEAVASLRTGGIQQVARDHPAQYVRYHRGFQALHFIDLASQTREPPTVIFCYGPPGCGKTRLAYADGNGVAKLCLAQGWFDGYLGEGEVIFDDFDGARSKLALSQLLNYLDRYPALVPVKGGHVPLVATTIWVTSNVHWKQWYDWSERSSQYHALTRRFTKVLAWPSWGAGPRTILPGSDAWRGFCNGPLTTGVVVEDITEEDDVYYTFVENFTNDESQ